MRFSSPVPSASRYSSIVRNGTRLYLGVAPSERRKGYATAYGLLDQASKNYLNNLNNDFLHPDWNGAMKVWQEYSDYWIEDASFFKIDDVNCGYTFKLGKPWIDSLRLAASVQITTFLYDDDSHKCLIFFILSSSIYKKEQLCCSFLFCASDAPTFFESKI